MKESDEKINPALKIFLNEGFLKGYEQDNLDCKLKGLEDGYIEEKMKITKQLRNLTEDCDNLTPEEIIEKLMISLMDW